MIHKISEIFLSIQGEGLRVGKPTVFIRTVGCNLRCPWCDTQYAYAGGTEMTLDEIRQKVDEYAGGAIDVCLTGGEPSLDAALIQGLVGLYNLSIETNGTILPPDGIILSSVAISPKLLFQPLEVYWQPKVIRQWINRGLTPFFKLVVANKDEAYKAGDIVTDTFPKLPVVFQLRSDVMRPDRKGIVIEIMKVAAHFARKGNDIRLLPQVHKIFDWR